MVDPVFFFLRSRAVSTVGDASQGVFDRRFVDDVGVMVVEPFLGFGVVRVFGIDDGIEHIVKAGDAAAILGQAVLFTASVTGIRGPGFAGADVCHGEPMLPAIADVVEMVDSGLLRFQHVAQADLAGLDPRLGSPIPVHRQPVSLPTDRELPEKVIEPPHDSLDNVVQDLERDRCRHLATWRQITGSVSSSSIRTVTISLTPSDAVLFLAGLMPPVC